jgi:hypothetical protein
MRPRRSEFRRRRSLPRSPAVSLWPLETLTPMFFRGLPSVPVRIAYLLIVISFGVAPVHCFIERRGVVHDALFVFASVVFVFCAGVGIFHKPRNVAINVAIIVYALVAWLLHGMLLPVL